MNEIVFGNPLLWVWLFTIPFTFWSLNTADFNVRWKDYPRYLWNNKRQAWPLISILAWLIMIGDAMR